MVKGISRRVVVIPSPDPKIFEQAIFIMRDDILASDGVSSEEVLKEAQRVARDFAKSQIPRGEKFYAKIPGPVFAAAGAAATCIAWLAMHLVGV